jgi:hypothetical protein
MPSATDETYTAPELRSGTGGDDNVSKAKSHTKNASKHDDGAVKATSQKNDMSNATGCHDHWEDAEHLARNLAAYKEFQENNRKPTDGAQGGSSPTARDDEGEISGKKRSRGQNASSPNKKQKSHGLKHDEPSGTAGDKDRVPKEGQKVQWNSIAGYVDGEVVEVVYEEKSVDGKSVKGSKEDPRVVLRSDASGKICVHKPEAVWFD